MFDRPKGGKTKSTFKNKDHGIWPHHFMANRQGENGNSDRFYFLGLQITVDGDCS